MDQVTIHAQCLFRSSPITECGRVVTAGADPAHWPLLVVGIAMLGICIALWLQTQNPINWDRRHDDPE